MENPVARININNIKHNLKVIRSKVNEAKILAVVKSNAYGHGAVKVAAELENDSNVSAFGVGRFSEAEELFNNGIRKPIVLLEGVLNQEQLKQCATNSYITVIGSHAQLDLVKNTSFNNCLNIWLKFNTGMNRLGFNASETSYVLSEIEKLIELKKLNKDFVVMTHFACADECENNMTRNQLEVFESIISNKSIISNHHIALSAANSAGVFGWNDSHFDWVRPGISMYGSSPLVNKTRDDLELKSTMELFAKVISRRIVKKGDAVGYKAKWKAPKDSLIAVIALGYADGYPRTLNNNYVWLHGKKCQVVGYPSMEMITVDCSSFDIDDINIGDEVEIWGNNIDIDTVAKNHQTISYELYTQLTARVEKVYV